ncbi:MAG TPA: pyruvate kinase [Chitinophagales bacterium]|nr:pyruvate kinase [Chitinophagales bacterium]
MFNKTKIIATVGPASNSKENIKTLIESGVDVFRLNFSHGEHEDHLKVINYILEANEEMNTHVGILADLQGPKIRLGIVENDSIELITGSEILITRHKKESTAQELYITYEPLAQDIREGNRILIDDGKVELRVIATNGIDQVRAKVMHGGILSSKKGVNLPDTNISAASLTPKDIRDLEFILTQKIDWIALSFVRSPNDMIHLRGIMTFKNNTITKIIAKIERPEAVENIEAIIREADAIMVARGDLGVEIPVEKVPLVQKDIVAKCIAYAKPVIIATQMMESMIEKTLPMRAEVTDVANAILDGADAIMLSGETAMGKHPPLVVKTMTRIAKEMEEKGNIYSKYHTYSNRKANTFVSDDVCSNACRIADEIDARAITGMTVSGYTAFMLACNRPKADIFIFTNRRENLSLFSLIWGVRTFFYDKFTTTDETMVDVAAILKEKGFVNPGDFIVMTASMPLHESGRTNTIRVKEMPRY